MKLREIERPASTIGRHPRVPRKAGSFGARLTARRLELGMTQRRVADMAGLHERTVAHLERDDYGTLPTAYTLAGLASALTCSMDWLFRGDE